MYRSIAFVVALFSLISCEKDKNTDIMEKVSIQSIRNATLKVDYAGKTILVDPMLSAKNSFMSFVEPDKNLNPTVDLPFAAEKVIENTDLVLLTHAHPDHLDAKAIELLPKNIPFYAQATDQVPLKDAPFTNIKWVKENEEFEGIQIMRTDGKHGPDELLEALGKVSGYILKAKNHPSIYIVGDCLYDETVKQTIQKHQPDIIITNSGGAMFMGNNRILMDAEETIALAKDAPNSTVIAVHMEALDHCTVTKEALKNKAANEKVKIIIPKDGETINL